MSWLASADPQPVVVAGAVPPRRARNMAARCPRPRFGGPGRDARASWTVSRILSAAPRGAACSHFSGRPVAGSLVRATRPDARGHGCLRLPEGRGCLRLHAVGFAVPWASPSRRCALTAPFHPCHARPRAPFGGLFSVALSRMRARAHGWPLATTVSNRVRTFLRTPCGGRRLHVHSPSVGTPGRKASQPPRRGRPARDCVIRGALRRP